MALRWTVFVEEQGVPEADELDGSDVGGTMIMAKCGGDLVGTARFHLAGDVIKISRVCVHPAARGSGIGAQLIEFLCNPQCAKHARLDAQTDALAFYRRLGFLPVGEDFLDAGIPHRRMEKRLAN